MSKLAVNSNRLNNTFAFILRFSNHYRYMTCTRVVKTTAKIPLVRQVRGSIRWRLTKQKLAAKGLEVTGTLLKSL